jgi:hypothetical protein
LTYMFKKKKIMAFSLLLLVAMPLLIFSFLQLKQLYIQHQMEERLELASLKTIELSYNSFTWIKNGKEILINNKLFDVKSFTKKENSIVFTGLYDNDEDSIQKSIEHLAQHEKNDGNPIKLSILKLAFSPMMKSQFTFETNIFFTQIQKVYAVFQENSISQSISVPTTPPLV